VPELFWHSVAHRFPAGSLGQLLGQDDAFPTGEYDNADAIRDVEVLADEQHFEPQLLLGRELVRQIIRHHAERLERPTSYGHRRHAPGTVAIRG
jgi:hypothetical protein